VNKEAYVKQHDDEKAWDRRGFLQCMALSTEQKAGRYEIACSEFCGSGHGQMKAALVSIGPTQTNR
jgi:hypothetical protein